MTVQETITNWQLHPSQRGAFSYELFLRMAENEKIFLILPDLGFAVFDRHREHFPDRVKVIGASEQAALGIAVGLALEQRIPFVYSITTFLLYRPFEWLRVYLNHENISVRLVGSGLDDDYKHDGITHHAFDAKAVLNLFPHIDQHFPESKDEISPILDYMIETSSPSFLCLRR